MRTKIDYGIDLGTTNSAIARMENGQPVIKKSDFQKDTIPSCITINKKKDILVGDPAFHVLRNDRTRALKTFRGEQSNTFIEFKRTMGTDTSYPSSFMEREFSSEALSAEVLKRLKTFVGDETIKSVVITVPAKFTMVQKDATVRAGHLAGFRHVELLQEPIAASMAYGLTASNKDGIWMVFDFGGGTFDAALIRVEEGLMRVIDTEGDNWLGGQNLDYAIVDQIIIPYFEKNYALDSILQNSGNREILRNAVKWYAEECKIQMSTQPTHNILTDLDALPFTDENGEEPTLDILVDQAQMERTVAPIFQKAIDICKDLLRRNNLKGSQLTTLLLVGGPTYSPILRKMLAEQITDKVNISIDPMTSVARGAALYASTIDVAEEIIEEVRDRTKIQLDLKYEPTTVEMDELVNIKMLPEKTTGKIPEKVYAELSRGDKAWSSGKKSIGTKAVLVEVQLNGGTTNTFEIVLYDEQGNKFECEPSTFNILQGINPGKATLPYHLGIEITNRTLNRDVFIPAKGLEKNQPLPATGVITGLRTQRPIRPGMAADRIIIPIYQGDYIAEGTRAIYNEHVNNVMISGESLPALLPEGSEIEITVKVDRSEKMTLSAFFPFLNHTEEIPVHISVKEQVDETWLQQELQQALATAREVGKTMATAQLKACLETLEQLRQALENERSSVQGKFKILENLRKELRVLDNLQYETEWPLVEKELKQDFYSLEELINDIRKDNLDRGIDMEKIRGHVAEIREKIEKTIFARDIKTARELIIAVGQIDFELRNAVTGGGMLIAYLRQVNDNFESYTWRDRNKARELCRQGAHLASLGRAEDIRPILQELFNLMSKEQAEELLGKLTN